MFTEHKEIRHEKGKFMMRKRRKGMLLILFLMLGMCWMFVKQQAAAEEVPSLAYIYTGEDGAGGRLIVASVYTGGESLECAELFWDTGGEVQSAEALEVVDGYAAFMLEGAPGAEQMQYLRVVCGGAEHVLDIQAFRAAEDTVEDTAGKDFGEGAGAAEQENTGELPVAGDSEEVYSVLSTAETEAAASENYRGFTPGNGLNRGGGDIVVVLDPGHGGSDYGAYRTWDNISYIEKNIALKISKYTKEELEKYAGVRVYLTRSTDAALSLADRVAYAEQMGATVLISQHINSTGEQQSTATGAEVMVSKGNYRPEQAAETGAIARAVLAELEKIGFKNRDLVYKLSETGNTYPNKKLADYYGIVRMSVLAGFPGMIVEHGFVSNPEDCVKYYGSNAKIKKMGVADATAIAKYYNLQKKSTIGWNQEKGQWYYVREDGQRQPPGWLNAGGAWYYLDSNGYRVTGWQTLAKKKYYFNSEGVRQTGLTAVDGKNYYFNSKGMLKKGFFSGFDGNSYYADKSGILYSGWRNYKGKKYYFHKKTHAARTGWAKLGKYYYYFNEAGQMQRGIVESGGEKYYLDSNGRKSTGLIAYEGRKYYFDKSTGKMLKKTWKRMKAGWYYFSKYGYAIQGKTKRISGVRYKFNEEGICLNKSKRK